MTLVARGLVALLLMLAAALPLRAQDLRPVPPLASRVIDQTGTLTAEQSTALQSKLAAFEAEAGPQIVIVMVPSTAPEDITDFTQRLGDAWKLGRREVGDGLLIVVAKDDRRVRIAPAKALEGAVPDLAARQIIERAIVPAFRAGDYAGGLNQALDHLFARIRGEALPAPTGKRLAASQPGVAWDDLLMFFFIGVPIVGSILSALLGRKLGTMLTAGGTGLLGWVLSASFFIAIAAGVVALVLAAVMGTGIGRRRGGGLPVIWTGGGGGSSWGGGDFGGFSSGGGGDFGGGGASGDW